MNVVDVKASFLSSFRNESQPKTIDQIQKEAERENMQMNIALNAYQERNKRQDVRNSTDGRKSKFFCLKVTIPDGSFSSILHC